MSLNIIILFVAAGLCNGSTTDSGSVCEGSSPSPATKAKSLGPVEVQGFLFT